MTVLTVKRSNYRQKSDLWNLEFVNLLTSRYNWMTFWILLAWRIFDRGRSVCTMELSQVLSGDGFRFYSEEDPEDELEQIERQREVKDSFTESMLLYFLAQCIFSAFDKISLNFIIYCMIGNIVIRILFWHKMILKLNLGLGLHLKNGCNDYVNFFIFIDHFSSKLS